MKKLAPLKKLVPNLRKAKELTIKISDQTIAKTTEASNFLTDFADVLLFISRTVKETFSRNFEFKEFLNQCYQIGNKTLCLLYTSPSPRDRQKSRMPSSA